jgi:DNA-binding Xre family transcriptional regulator
VFALYHDKARRVDLATLNALCRTLEAGVGDLFEYVPEDSD